jgi:hypothetical protein
MVAKKQPNNKFTQVLQKTFNRFLKIRGNPREIALGAALGLFVSMTPFIGLHTVMAILFAALFKWNKISAALGVWVTNPFTAPFIYGLTYFVGKLCLGIEKSPRLHTHLDYSMILGMLQKTPEILLILTVGGIIVGLPLAFLGYYFSYSAISRYQQDIRDKLARRRKKKAKKKEKKKARKKARRALKKKKPKLCRKSGR